MKKISAVLLMGFMILGLSGFTLAESNDNFCHQRDLSFMRDIIYRVQHSNLSHEDRNIIFQRMRDYLADRHLLRPFILETVQRIKMSNMNQEDKNILFQRLRDFIDQKC